MRRRTARDAHAQPHLAVGRVHGIDGSTIGHVEPGDQIQPLAWSEADREGIRVERITLEDLANYLSKTEAPKAAEPAKK